MIMFKKFKIDISTVYDGEFIESILKAFDNVLLKLTVDYQDDLFCTLYIKMDELETVYKSVEVLKYMDSEDVELKPEELDDLINNNDNYTKDLHDYVKALDNINNVINKYAC